VLTASRLLEDVAEHVRQTMWHAMRAARGESPAADRSPAGDLVHVGDHLALWAVRERPGRSTGGIGI
jgi:hypothetical protein